jgi:beta-lactam-binding protein with PASTA domain
VGDCPKCGLANPGAVDFCPNPQCRTYLGWASAASAGPPPRPATQGQPPSTQRVVAVPHRPSAGPPTAQTSPAPGPSAGPSQKRGVRVTVDPAELTVDPGGEVTTTVTVRNLGTRVEEFRLMPGGPAATFASIEPTTLSIYPEDEQRAEARFAPVRGPQSPAGVAPFEIVARSAIHGDVSDIARGQVTVTPFAELSAVLRPEVSRGRRPVRHQVRVTNAGNTPVNAALAFSDQDGKLTFEPPSGSTTLPPGATLDYSVRINGPHRWFGRTERLPFSAVVTPAGSQPPITLNGTRQQTAVFPWWIPIAAAILIALILPLFFLFKPGTPTVPQVGDFTQSAAEQELRDAGYVVSGATPISDPKQAGLVVKTDPAAGSPLKKQERVQMFVSTGPCNPVCKVTVPATKGRTEADARAVLGAAGFTVGQVVQSPSDLPVGSVKETSPAEQTEAPTNVPVAVFVSSGTRLTADQLASYQGQSAAAVKAALGGSVKVTEMLEHTNEFAKGKVVRVVQDASDPRRLTLFIAVPTATDLVAMANKASWRSSAGTLTFPGKVTDAKGAVLVANAPLPDGTTGRVLGTIPPKTGGSVTGAFTLSPNQKIIAGDRLIANVGLLAPGATGPVQFAVKIGDQIPLTVTVEPGQLMAINQPLDAFQGATTIEIAVTSSPPAVAPPAVAPPAVTLPAPGGATTTPTTAVNQAVWQNLRIEGTVKNP